MSAVTEYMRSINLGLYAGIAANADKLYALADTAMAWREATEAYEEGGGGSIFTENPPRHSMSARTYNGIASILVDLALDVAASPEYRAGLARSEAEGRRIGRIQNAKRSARASENRRAKELGHCPRCVNGYIPNQIQDGGICYRCNGTGR